jgi:hypothetical protein
MNVVALKAAAEPAPTLLSVYCAQAYWVDRGRLVEGRLHQFSNMEAALRAGQRVAQRAPAVRVYRVRGNPEVDYWEPRVTLAKYGEWASDL